jgi:hypothetical protein
MFKVYDKDAGTFMDVREILDLNEEDFKDNKNLKEILSYMNTNNPVEKANLSESKSSDDQNSMNSRHSKERSYQMSG